MGYKRVEARLTTGPHTMGRGVGINDAQSILMSTYTVNRTFGLFLDKTGGETANLTYQVTGFGNMTESDFEPEMNERKR